MSGVSPVVEEPDPRDRRSRRPHRMVVAWSDLLVLFVVYVVGQLVVGLALGGNLARDVAFGNLAGGVGALVVVAILVWVRSRRR